MQDILRDGEKCSAGCDRLEPRETVRHQKSTHFRFPHFSLRDVERTKRAASHRRRAGRTPQSDPKIAACQAVGCCGVCLQQYQQDAVLQRARTLDSRTRCGAEE